MEVAVTAGHVAVPPEFRESEAEAVDVTGSEKVIVMGTESLTRLYPEADEET